MPPKVKFTKDEIIQAALNVARVKGASSVSTRDIAAELQVSTRPIFTYFDTMEEVRAEIRKAAEAWSTFALPARSRNCTGCCF